MIVLARVISGGQTGVDQAALRAARAAGIATAGWAPRGWRTLAGAAPWLADFGLVEHAASGYLQRTEANVRDSDATLRLARDFTTAGEVLTQRCFDKLRRPSISIREHDLGFAAVAAKKQNDALAFLAEHGVQTLNVAGNAEEHAPGIGVAAERWLAELFRRAVAERFNW